MHCPSAPDGICEREFDLAFHPSKRAGRRAGSYRTCQGCRRRILRRASLRIIRDPEGRCRPDLFGKLPGRGMHVCPNIACFEAAKRNQAASRAFHKQTSFGDPRTMAATFLDSGRRQALAQLSVAVRSGFLIAGRTAVMDALKAGRSAMVLLATDGSHSLRREVSSLAGQNKVPSFSALDKQSLSSFHHGKPLAVVAVSHRGIASRLSYELKKICELQDSLGEFVEREGHLTVNSVRGKMRTHHTDGSGRRS